MEPIPRLYDAILADHFAHHRQMALLAGPRQVGKTTVCRRIDGEVRYLNWDDKDDRTLILRGPKTVAQSLGLERLGPDRPCLVLDEVHKYPRWKTFLKGLFDGFADRLRIAVTGSSRLDVFRRGGDSLMGRYLLYHMHPLSVGELLRQDASEALVRPPAALPSATWSRLRDHGGFPEPFAKDARFGNRWRDLRREQLLREDVRDLTRIQAIDQLEVLEELLRERSGKQLSYSELARTIHVSVDTARRWVGALVHLHHGFLVRPWFRNVAKSLRKEPKWYMSDWSSVADPGHRAETFLACHLRKAVDTWQDLGHGKFDLRYLRDKDKREVDFCVVRDGKPWFLVEGKLAEERLAPELHVFQAQTQAAHAFQAVVTMDYVDSDCFARRDPTVVPAATLLSQLP